jgi:hypothetical protein
MLSDRADCVVADFDEADFSIAENVHPDEVTLESSIERANSPIKHPETLAPAPNPSVPGRVPAMPNPAMGAPNLSVREPGGPPQGPLLGRPTTRTSNIPAQQTRPEPASPVAAAVLSTIAKDLGDYEHDPNVGFCQARVAEKLQNGDNSVLTAAPFNPKHESSTLRRTSGVDHTTSKPLTRPRVGPPLPPTSNTSGRSNFVNPHLDPNRRIGMPVTGASPLQNRHSYKAPSMKRLAEGGSETRSALSDVTASNVNVPTETASEGKRVKMETPVASSINGVNR